MEIEDNKSTLKVVPKDEQKIRKIWKTALILLLITVGEFILAFTIDRGILLYTIYMLLTIWKAKYIIMEFMHLKDEVKLLIYSIIVPLIFLIWLAIVLMKEGVDMFGDKWM
jgi:cytochrome c oxidase subunit IV